MRSFSRSFGKHLLPKQPKGQHIAIAGWVELGGKRFYARSKMEANYARYLQWLKERSEIADWEHEPQCFWFNEIQRGVRSYLPDFKVIELNGRVSWHEVKGYMDSKSKTKIKRFRKYYPKETLIVITSKEYADIKKKVGGLITDWQ